MQVSLKKGAALALALSSVPIKLDHTYNIDIFGGIPTQNDIEVMNAVLLAQVTEALRVNGAVYKVRSLIGKANEGKINELLTERAEIDKSLAIFNGLPLRDGDPNLNAMAAKMQALKDQSSSSVSYGKPTSVQIELRTDKYPKDFVRPLKKRRLKVEDELAHLNFTTMIELPDEVVAVLTAYDLI